MIGPARVAVIGSGPAGVYTVQALLGADAEVSVDVLDRLPAPYGLVRYGVAPDHPKIRSIEKTLRVVLESPQVRFLGNVDYGTDLTLDDLREHYHAVVFAVGSAGERRMDIPGEDLPGSLSAADFVAWYNGHPGVDPEPPAFLSARSVAVVGAGNVALDVARILARETEDLAPTDAPEHVLAALRTCPADDVHLVARRGAAYAKFTPVELREMGKLSDVDVVIDPSELDTPGIDDEIAAGGRRVAQNVEIMRGWAKTPRTDAPRRVHFHFSRRPVQVLGSGAVEAIEVERTTVDEQGNAVGTGETERIPAQAVVRAVGYLGTPVPGLPFDQRSGTVPQEDGRVTGADGGALSGVYVSGWIKRGPTGVIGTNRSDATATVHSVLEDLPKLAEPSRPEPEAVEETLRERGVDFVTWDGWVRLDEHEIARGQEQGRARAKVADRATMLDVCRG